MKEDRVDVAAAPESGSTAPGDDVRSADAPDEAAHGKSRVTEDRPAAHPGPPKTVWREYFESAVVTVIMALFGITFIMQAVKVPTGSMENTITIGDHLLVNKFIFAPGPYLPFLPQREIKRGDIIVFKYPGNHFEPWRDERAEGTVKPYEINYVKRVIGLPGDRIEIRGQRVIVNGQVLPERRVTAEDPGDGAPASDRRHNAALKVLSDQPSGDGPYTVFYLPRSNRAGRVGADEPDDYPVFRKEFGGNGHDVVVPGDSYFVMGDNRDNSEDSRYWGFVRRDLVIGRAMFVYWSYDESAPSRGNILLDFIENTRWGRTGTMIK